MKTGSLSPRQYTPRRSLGTEYLEGSSSPTPVKQHSSGLRRNVEDDPESSSSTPADKLYQWKSKFNEELLAHQEELLVHLLYRHSSNEELALMIRNSFSDVKLSISELLVTMSDVVKDVNRRSKQSRAESDNYWNTVSTGLNNQIERLQRQRAVDDEMRKELINENKQLRVTVRNLKLEMKNKIDSMNEMAKRSASPKQTRPSTPQSPRNSTPTRIQRGKIQNPSRSEDRREGKDRTNVSEDNRRELREAYIRQKEEEEEQERRMREEAERAILEDDKLGRVVKTARQFEMIIQNNSPTSPERNRSAIVRQKLLERKKARDERRNRLSD